MEEKKGKEQKVVEHNYKGLTKDMKGHGDFQFEVGKTYTEDDAIPCAKGFHACRDPIYIFNYYPPSTSRYFEVEQSGKIAEHPVDTKVASTEIKIGAEIGIPGIVKGHIEWVKKHVTNEHNAEAGKPATAGDHEAASAGECGVSSAGECGVSSAGECGVSSSRGSSSVGKNGVAVARGNNVKVKGGLGAVLVLVEETPFNCDIAAWQAFVVDGTNIKADTWYCLKGGAVAEADDES